MNIKKLIFKNIGLKLTAVVLAVIVWVMISGRERAYYDKTLSVPVEYFNVGDTIDVRNVRPDRVRLTIRGTSHQLAEVTPEDFKINIDLRDVTEGNHLKFTENYLQAPENIKVITIHNRTIEITIREFLKKEVPVRIRYRGSLPKGVELLERRIIPDKVKIFGLKTHIQNIRVVEGLEPVNLSEITATATIKMLLKQNPNIIHFVDTDVVDVVLTVESAEGAQNGKDTKK